MRAASVLLFVAFAGAQTLPPWITELLPKSKAPVVAKAHRMLAELQAPHAPGKEYVFTEAEANAYLAELWRANPKTGFSDPFVSFPAKNRVSVVFDFDLQQFLAWRPQWRARVTRFIRIMPSGAKKLSLQLRFDTEGQKLRVEVEQARLNGHYVAPQLLNLGLRLVRRWKSGRINVVDGMPLPWGLHHIVTAPGQIRIGA